MGILRHIEYKAQIIQNNYFYGGNVMKKFKLGSQAISALMLALAITGCGSSSDNASFTTKSESAKGVMNSATYYEDSAAETAAATEDFNETGDSTTEVDESSQTSDRKLITTVRIDAETLDFNETTAWVESRTSELGGYIESSSISLSGGYYYNDKYTDLHFAEYTIRVPESKLGDFLEDVEGKTNITYKNQSVEDVTLSYTDIVARKEALETEKETLKKLMEQAESMEDLLVIQSQLTEVQYQIDSITSQLRVYDNKIDYSTIYLSIEEVEPDDLTITQKRSVGQRIAEGFLSSLKATGNFLLELGIAIIINLPQIILFAGIIVVIVLIIKRSNRKKEAALQERLGKFSGFKKDKKSEKKENVVDQTVADKQDKNEEN